MNSTRLVAHQSGFTQPSRKSTAGFTLIEVMIALFIVAIALGGAVKAMGNAANNSAALADKTFAQWVGLNQFARLKLSGEWPKPGEQKGDEEMAHRKWLWVQKIMTTEDKNVNRVEILISDAAHEDNGISAKIVGFLAKPGVPDSTPENVNPVNVNPVN
jgi:general secretion pathway protein I